MEPRYWNVDITDSTDALGVPPVAIPLPDPVICESRRFPDRRSLDHFLDGWMDGCYPRDILERVRTTDGTYVRLLGKRSSDADVRTYEIHAVATY